MTTPERNRPLTVRLFPDYAGTVLWFSGPVRYEDSGLTQGLIRALQSWEESYYHSMTPDIEWVSAEAAHRFTAEGNRLAECVADELGERYDVGFASYEDGVPARIFRASGPARNAEAVAAFDVLTAARQTGGDGSGWYAWAPLSDTSFGPPRNEDE